MCRIPEGMVSGLSGLSVTDQGFGVRFCWPGSQAFGLRRLLQHCQVAVEALKAQAVPTSRDSRVCRIPEGMVSGLSGLSVTDQGFGVRFCWPGSQAFGLRRLLQNPCSQALGTAIT